MVISHELGRKEGPRNDKSYGRASIYASTSFISNEQKTTLSIFSPSDPVRNDLTSEIAASAASTLGYP
jgi:hypothetical protein